LVLELVKERVKADFKILRDDRKNDARARRLKRGMNKKLIALFVLTLLLGGISGFFVIQYEMTQRQYQRTFSLY